MALTANLEAFKGIPEVCSGIHNYFIAEVVGVQSEGKVYVLALCRSCGNFIVNCVVVGPKESAIRLLRAENAAETN